MTVVALPPRGEGLIQRAVRMMAESDAWALVALEGDEPAVIASDGVPWAALRLLGLGVTRLAVDHDPYAKPVEVAGDE